MRLTQIKLAGFKSFVDPTVIPTPGQRVGIVGPNGCGKSNIIDAVRWVLGETRASELRGESMQDVIFNGSGQRKPAGRASVELIFDNSQGRGAGQWSSYTEIAVRRVLTRDGTSSYFVNNQQVRRRDVHDIFMGTGLGTRGYAIIGQGMINRLIEARPEELRVYLEEAAGVSRYKERRRETESRLADTRENLTRLDDILRELSAQLQHLDEQAQVAQHYHSLQAEGEEKQHVLWLQKETHARNDQKARFLAVEQAQTELEAAIAGLRSTQASLESQRQAHYAAADAVHAAQGQLYEANSRVSRLEAEIRHVADSRARLQARQQQLQQQKQEWTEQQEHCSQEIELAQAEVDDTDILAEEARARLEQAQTCLPDLEDAVRRASYDREALRRVISGLEQELALVAQSQRDAARQSQALVARQERLKVELGTSDGPDGALIDRVTGDLAVTAAQVQEAQDLLAKLEQRAPECDDQRQQAQAASLHASQSLARLEARLSALEALQNDVQQQGTLQPWLARHGLTQLGRLWQQLHIEAGWETALEAVLTERMSALEVRQLDKVQAFAQDLPPARLAFYQLPAAVTPNLRSDTHGLRSITQLLRVDDDALRGLLAQWLGQVYVCRDMAGALAMRAKLASGAVCVVAEGHIVDSHSVRFYAPDSEQAGMLARQQEIENLHHEIKAGRLMADQALSVVAKTESAWQQSAASLAAARSRTAELTRRLHELQLEQARLQQQAAQSRERAQRLEQDLTELSIQIQELTAQEEQAEARFEGLDVQLGEHQEHYAQAEVLGETLHNNAEQARLKVRDLERGLRDTEYATRTLHARILELKRNLQLAQEQAGRSQNELTSLQGELFELDASAAQAALQDALALRIEREDELSRARIVLDELAAALRDADEKRLLAEQTLEPRRARITQLQLEEQAARLALEQFAQQLDAAEVDRQKLLAMLEQRPEEWRRSAWLQSEVQRISRRIDSLGAVNLAALDELKAARERKGFLDAQHLDLSTAINTLEEAIRKIDRETRDLLQSTFDQVNRHFGELFPELFGGGEAKLSITGDEILDAGVQVMAQPPGKRNTTIHLLSGGEKALTATALVFALFRLNPAPFCLLDEVDAPLDDANTQRYAKLVSSMSQHTQFLFISHNKIAMQMAKQLVGVTMQEQGVSRIVAVDIDSALQLAEV